MLPVVLRQNDPVRRLGLELTGGFHRYHSMNGERQLRLGPGRAVLQCWATRPTAPCIPLHGRCRWSKPTLYALRSTLYALRPTTYPLRPVPIP